MVRTDSRSAVARRYAQPRSNRLRYARGAVGGVAVIAAGFGGLHYFQVTARPLMTPSIEGMTAANCVHQSPFTTCAAADSPLGSVTTSVGSSGGSEQFRDGTYSAQGNYLTPGGDEAIGVRLTVASGRVVRSRVEVEATSPTAQQFQRQFASRYAAEVVSRDLASLGVSRVAGASLTSLGFDNALATIKAAARVQD